MKKRISAGLVAAAMVTAAGCGSSSGGSAASASDAAITLGATLSLTGSLGSIGSVQEAGYQQYVSDVNAKGGLNVGGKQRKLRLVVLDNRSDPTTASQQASELILKDNAVALLGACTPPITVPVGFVAEKNRTPDVTSCTPTEAFAAANKAGWQYTWDFFFNENDQARLAFQGAAMANTNRKVALFTDTEADGVVERTLFKQAGAAAGFTIAGDYSFPVGTSDFSSFITDAKSKGAEVVVAQMVPPDGIAMVKQMKALGFAPKFILVEKAADTPAWVPALGPLAEGTAHQLFWSEAKHYPGSSALEATLGKKFPDVGDLGFAVAAYSAAEIVGDAITSAGSTASAQVNAEIKATDKTYPFGPIKFGSDHTDSTPLALAQWQKGSSAQILPSVSGVTLEVPPPGLG